MRPTLRIAAALALGLHLSAATACAAEPAKPAKPAVGGSAAKSGSRADKEKTMKSSAIGFSPIDLTDYPQSGSRTPEGRLPNDIDTPPQLFWIRTDSGFAKFGYKVRVPSSNAGTPPDGADDIDFNKHDVILLTMGVQGTTGFELKLIGIRLTGQEVRFLLKAKIPGRNDGVGEALTHPGVLARVDKLPSDSRLAMEMNGQETSFQLRILE